jgi:hypothetical protein
MQLSDLVHSCQDFGNAEDGYAGIVRCLPLLKNAAHRTEIEQGLKKLRAALDELASGGS